jgi:hypothetical protein
MAARGNPWGQLNFASVPQRSLASYVSSNSRTIELELNKRAVEASARQFVDSMSSLPSDPGLAGIAEATVIFIRLEGS